MADASFAEKNTPAAMSAADTAAMPNMILYMLDVISFTGATTPYDHPSVPLTGA